MKFLVNTLALSFLLLTACTENSHFGNTAHYPNHRAQAMMMTP